ncbi:helix-turn-helix domain-containing protein [Xylanibacter ruminicola]|uniref:helix-turn-helix domain-containing protein n=1 Tax=Xylanibacter ruminicola TaxID=839 RepID=UPI00048F3D70|nr:helix-turn-helix domain-containing protein [Xylanibacter ruminicola]
MVNYTNEELLEVLPPSLRESKELTTKQKVVLGQLVIYNGLEIVKKDGYFYRSNKDLCNDCDVQEKTLIAAVNKLVMLGFIERKSGSRKDGASLYRINQKLIVDYCRTPIDDNCKKEIDNHSNDYSKQIVEMTNRIKELEITVKRLVERITVIEGKNYSTEEDIDKELDKENNILNNIEKTEGNKELEIVESLTESQQTLTESLMEKAIKIEETHIPSEDEQYQQWFQVISPYLKELESVRTLEQFRNIKNRLSQSGSEYLDSHEDTSPTVIEKMNKVVGSALRDKKTKLIPDEMEISEYLSVVQNYGSLQH